MSGPMILANVAIPLRGAVDTAMVGHLAEPYFLVAVATGTTVFNFIFFAFNCLRMGTTAPTAQASGSGDSDEVRAILWRALCLSILISTGLVLLQLPIIDSALWMISASAEAETHARTFFLIRIWAMPAALATYAVVGWLYGLEDARVPLVLQITTNVINIALDFLFVFGFGWGVAGVAMAGLIADFAGLSIAFYVIFRRLGSIGGTTHWSRVFDVRRMRRMLAINRDIFLRTFCVVSVSAIFIARSAELGDLEAAANQILLNFLMFTSFGIDGLAFAAEAMIGEAIGRRNLSRFQIAVRGVLLWTAVFAVVNTAIYWLFGLSIVYLMTDIESVRRTAELYIAWSIAMPIVSSWAFTFDGIFIGATRTRTLRNSMFAAFAVFLAVVFAVSPYMENHGLWLAFFLFLTLRGAILASLYPRLRRSLEAVAVEDGNRL
jgi:multidrug resistance protein, MATE family|tara:strand:- start:657 stop:1961 length:1305 start_codon:yes stop_codon:yes gene_type:complete